MGSTSSASSVSGSTAFAKINSLNNALILDYNNSVDLSNKLNGVNKTYTPTKRGIIKISLLNNSNSDVRIRIVHSGINEDIFANYRSISAAGYVPGHLDFAVNANETCTVTFYTAQSLYGFFVPYK